MLIVHFSATRLSGMPLRLVRALQEHTPHEARLVDLARREQFGHDLVHGESVDDVVELCERADVIHLHNYLDYDSKQFAPVDFEALHRKGKRFVRHFNSSPETVAAHLGTTVERVLSSPMPAV